MTREAFAPGKIILTGEFAVVFGEPGIAVPSPLGMHVRYEENLGRPDLQIEWKGEEGGEGWMEYLREIVERCQDHPTLFCGTLRVENTLPLGKGMGSSTSLVVAVTRALLGEEYEKKALEIEDAVNPRHSGLDFSVIWSNRPLLFQRGKDPEYMDLPQDLLKNAVLIDTGPPNETTSELISWIEARKENLQGAFAAIGQCTRDLANGRELGSVVREHHDAQIQLGVVPKDVQTLVEQIERCGGSAKIIGAGGRTGGGGMLLALHPNREKLLQAVPDHFPLLEL